MNPLFSLLDRNKPLGLASAAATKPFLAVQPLRDPTTARGRKAAAVAVDGRSAISEVRR